jgi:hypothetical protein
MRYVEARYNLYNRDLAYRIYVTDALKVLGGLNIRFADLFKPEETRTAGEIIGGIRDKLQKMGGE